MPSQVFDAEQIRSETFVRTVEIYESIGSTNDRALELAKDPNLELPALVVAETQTAGRGQRGNSWWSPEGALLFSLVCERPEYLEPGEFSLCAAFAIFAPVEMCKPARTPKPSITIKWPNDVFADHAKIAGMLIEKPHTSFKSNRAVIGIGLNVNNDCDSQENPVGEQSIVSMKSLAGRTFTLHQTLLLILKTFASNLKQLETTKQEKLRQALSLRCYLSGKEVTIQSGSERITGWCQGTRTDGSLLVWQADGTSRRITSGTVVSWQ